MFTKTINVDLIQKRGLTVRATFEVTAYDRITLENWEIQLDELTRVLGNIVLSARLTQIEDK